MVWYTKFCDDRPIRSRVILGKPEGVCITPPGLPVPARVKAVLRKSASRRKCNLETTREAIMAPPPSSGSAIAELSWNHSQLSSSHPDITSSQYFEIGVYLYRWCNIFHSVCLCSGGPPSVTFPPGAVVRGNRWPRTKRRPPVPGGGGGGQLSRAGGEPQHGQATFAAVTESTLTARAVGLRSDRPPQRTCISP